MDNTNLESLQDNISKMNGELDHIKSELEANRKLSFDLKSFNDFHDSYNISRSYKKTIEVLEKEIKDFELKQAGVLLLNEKAKGIKVEFDELSGHNRENQDLLSANNFLSSNKEYIKKNKERIARLRQHQEKLVSDYMNERNDLLKWKKALDEHNRLTQDIDFRRDKLDKMNPIRRFFSFRLKNEIKKLEAERNTVRKEVPDLGEKHKNSEKLAFAQITLINSDLLNNSSVLRSNNNHEISKDSNSIKR